MAQSQYRADLSKVSFPLLSEEQGRTLLGGARNESAEDNLPSIYYGHNIMPTDKGVQSIGYLGIASAAPVGANLADVRTVYSETKERTLLAIGVDTYRLNAGVWQVVTGGTTSPANDITIGKVNGISYIFDKQSACYTYDSVGNSYTPVTLTGVALPNTLGVVASSGYLMTYTEDAIAWSSTIDPTDFTPSPVTGAGGGVVAGLGGKIQFVLPIATGVLIYTETNVISGAYTGNVQYPFKFREVSNSKGGITLDMVAYEQNAANHFAYTSAGFQTLVAQKADTLLPDVTDFLSGLRFEDFDEGTGLLVTENLAAPMLKKIKYIASRYLVISYGKTSFTHAIIYDTALSKLGKLKITHTDCFDYVGDQADSAKESLAFLLPDGSAQVVDFATNSSGVVIVGKFQERRSRLLTLLKVEVENIGAADTCTLDSLYTLDGKNVIKKAGLNTYAVGLARSYSFRVTGINHSLSFIGKFNLTSLLLIYKIAGRR